MSTAEEPGGRPADADGLLLSVVYVSVATTTFTELDLALLLAISRANNEPRGVTGLLLHGDGRFVQALEGPEAEVRRTLDVIGTDPRHRDVRVIDETRTAERRFGSWAMAWKPVSDGTDDLRAWLGSSEAIEPRPGSRAAELLGSFRGR